MDIEAIIKAKAQEIHDAKVAAVSQQREAQEARRAADKSKAEELQDTWKPIMDAIEVLRSKAPKLLSYTTSVHPWNLKITFPSLTYADEAHPGRNIPFSIELNKQRAVMNFVYMGQHSIEYPAKQLDVELLIQKLVAKAIDTAPKSMRLFLD